MDSLFQTWRTKVPNFDDRFKKPLFKSFSQYGGGSEEGKTNLGKHFSNAYELYIYAFFLGLYRNENIPIPKESKKDNFRHAIQHWGNKSNRIDREEFSNIQNFIFMALIAKTDLDLTALEKGDLEEKEAVKQLLTTMESYTNGGLTLIFEKMDDNENYFLKNTGFLDFIFPSKS